MPRFLFFPRPGVPRSAWRLVALLGFSVALTACSGSPSAIPSPTPDAFAAVRATAEAAYQAGKEALEQGDLEQALINLDRAKVNDPDQRPEIQQALDNTLNQIQALPPPPTRTPIPSPTPFVVVGADAAATPTPRATPLLAAAQPTVPPGFVTWTDNQGRFSLAVPREWQVVESPQAAFGQGIVAFRSESGAADLTIAFDPDAGAVSPELYAATMEVILERAPGYARDSVEPGLLDGLPSLRSNFTILQRDGAGREVNVRGFRATVMRGNTPYVITATAPAKEFEQFAPTFASMLSSFSFL